MTAKRSRGRPALPDTIKRVSVTIRLPPDMVAKLPEKGRSAYIEKAILKIQSNE